MPSELVCRGPGRLALAIIGSEPQSGSTLSVVTIIYGGSDRYRQSHAAEVGINKKTSLCGHKLAMRVSEQSEKVVVAGFEPATPSM